MPVTLKKPPKRKPGQRAGLNRGIIIAKALNLIESNGDLSIVAIAKALKVAPAAVSAHFSGRLSEILSECAREVFSDVARPFQPGEGWEAYLQDLFVAISKAFDDHRSIALFVGKELASNYYLNPLLVERVLLALKAAGFPDSARAKALDLVMSSLIGFIAVECFAIAAVPQWIKRQSDMIDGLSASEHAQIKTLKHQLLEAAAERSAPVGGEGPPQTKAERYADHLIAGLKAQIPTSPQ